MGYTHLRADERDKERESERDRARDIHRNGKEEIERDAKRSVRPGCAEEGTRVAEGNR